MMRVANKIIGLAGNPNVGKSTIFNRLTGLRQHTGNWPGKTVVSARGTYSHNGKTFTVVDLPGTYSLLADSADEEVARDFICSGEADVTVVVVDATCLERNLNLVLQLLENTNKVVVCINLMDEAKKKGIGLDLIKLESELGVPVVGTSGTKGTGIPMLKDAITKQMQVEVEEQTISNANVRPKHSKEEALAILKRCQEIYQAVVTISETNRVSERDLKMDRILTSKVTGIPIMILLLFGVLWITIFGANYPSELIESGLMALIDPWKNLLTWAYFPDWLTSILVDGIYKAVAWVVAVMLPPMAIFFPLFTLLENYGYLPRIAFNLDNFFRKARAHGKQALTMCMGFGCNAAGVIGCRIINSPRERLVAIVTNNFTPCNGRFPLLIAIATMFFVTTPNTFTNAVVPALTVTAVIILGVIITFWTSKLLTKTILKGEASSFNLELPPYRKPQIGRVIVQSIFDRTLFVLRRAVIVAMPAGVIIWIMANIYVGDITLLTKVAMTLDPFAQLLGMDGYILLAFILAFPANEVVIPVIIMCYVASGSLLDIENLVELRQLFIDNGWTWLTAVSVMLFSLMHWPCGTTCLTIKKETGSWKWTAISFAIPTAMGIIFCFLVANVVRLLGLV